MPELPEVETVRRGLAAAVSGAQIIALEVRDARALKRHQPQTPDDADAAAFSGPGRTLSAAEREIRAADFTRRLRGQQLCEPERRGKFMWVPLAGTQTALLAHLGMSGQLLLRTCEAPDDRHVRIRMWLAKPGYGELRLDFADQRLFGSLAIDELVAITPEGRLPAQALHIARDPLDQFFDEQAVITSITRRKLGIKQQLLDQGVLSGVGNIYADEALWLAKLHPATAGTQLSRRRASQLLQHLIAVFEQALAAGGTSFDEQYVDVNGEAGYFSRHLHAYGRAGKPCPRCGTLLQRQVIAGRSAHFCPRCQTLPAARLAARRNDFRS